MTAPSLFDAATGPGTPAGPEPRPVLYLGRCTAKGCRARARIALPRLRRTVERRVSSYGERYELEHHEPAVLLDTPAGRGLVTFAELAARRWLPECIEHRRPLRFAKLEASYDAEKVCNARCMGAYGPSCECSCAGRNHGGRWG